MIRGHQDTLAQIIDRVQTRLEASKESHHPDLMDFYWGETARDFLTLDPDNAPQRLVDLIAQYRSAVSQPQAPDRHFVKNSLSFFDYVAHSIHELLSNSDMMGKTETSRWDAAACELIDLWTQTVNHGRESQYNRYGSRNASKLLVGLSPVTWGRFLANPVPTEQLNSEFRETSTKKTSVMGDILELSAMNNSALFVCEVSKYFSDQFEAYNKKTSHHRPYSMNTFSRKTSLPMARSVKTVQECVDVIRKIKSDHPDISSSFQTEMLLGSGLGLDVVKEYKNCEPFFKTAENGKEVIDRISYEAFLDQNGDTHKMLDLMLGHFAKRFNQDKVQQKHVDYVFLRTVVLFAQNNPTESRRYQSLWNEWAQKRPENKKSPDQFFIREREGDVLRRMMKADMWDVIEDWTKHHRYDPKGFCVSLLTDWAHIQRQIKPSAPSTHDGKRLQEIEDLITNACLKSEGFSREIFSALKETPASVPREARDGLLTRCEQAILTRQTSDVTPTRVGLVKKM